MGSPKVDDEPQHEAEIAQRFQMARYPVTNELYGLFDPQSAGRFDDYTQYGADPRCPAIELDWFDAWTAAL